MDIKYFRKQNGIKQEDLAAYLGVSRTFLSQIETGKCKLPFDKLRTLMDNREGWDCAMLTEEPAVTITQNGHHNIVGNDNVMEDSALNRLREIVDRQGEELKRMESLIQAQSRMIEIQQRMLSQL